MVLNQERSKSLMVLNQERSKSLMVLIRRGEELDGSKSG
jgi:hypothetical protein